MGGLRKQSKKTIQSLQISPRMASLRQVNVLVSLPYSPSQVGDSGYLPERKGSGSVVSESVPESLQPHGL